MGAPSTPLSTAWEAITTFRARAVAHTLSALPGAATSRWPGARCRQVVLRFRCFQARYSVPYPCLFVRAVSDILAVADVHQRVITKLSESRKVHKYFEMSPEAQHAFLHSSAAQSVTCIVSNGHKGASSQIISALPNLKLIACYGVGVDAVDLDSGQFF